MKTMNFHGQNMDDEFGIDTPIDVIQAYQARTSSGSRPSNGNAGRDIKAFIKANVWQKLSKEAKQAWITQIPEADKVLILQAAGNFNGGSRQNSHPPEWAPHGFVQRSRKTW